VIEDDADIQQIVEYNLAREGFDVLTAADGEDGLRLARQERPDLVVLDLLLPGLDGVEICRLLKLDPATRSMPVMMVTARGDESDIVLGLGVGADDYVAKPFSPRELAARVKALLRRGPLKEERARRGRIVRDDLVIDVDRHEVHVQGAAVPFRATEFRLLHFLAANAGRVFSRDQLLNEAISEGTFIIDRNIDVHIASIRKKLGEHRDLIRTIRGVGYRFEDA
jgi:DNA-binding response OmpR family regulator